MIEPFEILGLKARASQAQQRQPAAPEQEGACHGEGGQGNGEFFCYERQGAAVR
jgi:hypothetical protein